MRAGWVLHGIGCGLCAAASLVSLWGHAAEAAASSGEAPAAGNAVVGHWDALPVPAAESSGYPSGVNHVYDAGVDDGGILYVLANRSLYYWDGRQLTKTLGAPVTHGLSMVGFFGGSDRGLYVTQKGDRDFEGKLYRLSDGEAKFVTDFYCEDLGTGAHLYVSRAGRLICWGKRFVAWHTDGDWQRVETPMLLGLPQVFDTGEAVHVYYNGWLLTIGADGTAEARQLDVPITMEPDGARARGVLWGERTAFLMKENSNAVCAFTLPEGTPVDMRRAVQALVQRGADDVFRGQEGSVWLYTRGGTGTAYREGFVVLKPDGAAVSSDKVPALEWEGIRAFSQPHSVLVASDGTLWVAETFGGVAACRDGTLTRFGWRQGVKTPCNWLAEGPRGEIYAGLTSGVTDALYVFHKGETPSEPPKWAELWHEYRLTCQAMVRDGDGAMWMSLADRPGPVSRWHKGTWTDMAAPSDANAVWELMPDDQGRVVVCVRAGNRAAYLVDKDGATGFDRLADAVSAAVGKGARRFFSASGCPSCIVTDEGKIWLVEAGYSGLEHYDGKRWDSFRMGSERIVRLERDEQHEVVVCVESGKRFVYDRGQFVALPGSAPPKRGRNDKAIVFPSGRGGCWTKASFAEPFKRSFGGAEFACDFGESPFPRGFTPHLIAEDGAGNLWIDTWGARLSRRVFMKETSGFRLTTGGLPNRVPRVLHVEANVTLRDEPQDGWRLFYRLNNEEWQGGEPAPDLTIAFPKDGTYEVELTGMGPLGETTPESVKFTVESKAQ